MNPSIRRATLLLILLGLIFPAKSDGSSTSSDKAQENWAMYANSISPWDRFLIEGPPGKEIIFKVPSRPERNEIHNPTASDPRLVLYIDDEPLKLFMPTYRVAALKNKKWTYRECEYWVAQSFDEESLNQLRKTKRDDDHLEKFVVIAAECGADSNTVSRYYFDERDGLLAISHRQKLQVDGETQIKLEKTFFLRSGKGFGGTIYQNQ